MKFREHRGTLAESMTTEVELQDRPALVEHLAQMLKPWGWDELPDSHVTLVEYYPDSRIGWHQQSLVIVKRYGIAGMIDAVEPLL